MIVFKLSFLVGLVLASPVLLWQLWAFLAPALYEREKKALVPALFVGTLLFLIGAVLAFHFVVPQALRVLFSFQTEAISPFITYDAYFGFVLQVVLALGLSFELPLIIIILSWLGVVGPAELSKFRRYAVVLAFIAGAVLSPGADLLSMLMMTAPLILLYEVGRGGVGRRPPASPPGRDHGAGAARSGIRCDAGRGAGRAAASADGRGHGAPRFARDTTGIRPGQSLDSATASGWACRPRLRGASPTPDSVGERAAGATGIFHDAVPVRLGHRVRQGASGCCWKARR